MIAHANGAPTVLQQKLLSSLNVALHDLSQPLTSVIFAVELSGVDEDAASRQTMLATARAECGRVMHQVELMRELCAELMEQTNMNREAA